MIISVNWLKKFVDIDLPIEDLATLIGERLVEIESVESIGEKYKDVLIVKVVKAERLEESDHLSLVLVDDGGKAEHVERTKDGLVEIVCGAPNVRADMYAAWLPPKSIVPETFGTKDPFVLSAKEFRGHVSNGMLASAKELALYDDHDGIVEIDEEVAPGTSFSELYELDDYLLDIENKSLTHRPDTFGIIGFAREIAGIQGKQFTTPSWFQNLDPVIESSDVVAAPQIMIDDPSLSDRFQAIILDTITEGAKSSIEMQTFLARSGVRPIDAIVDVTNYMMLLTGRPLHAYDYDKVLALSPEAQIHVRSGRPGETLKLLNDKEIQLHEDDIVIAAGETAIGLGGAMGGLDTEVSSTTTRIMLECATFNLYKLRNMQMRHGVFTEAITRLTKGQPAPLGTPVLAESVKMMNHFAGARAASVVGDAYPGYHEPITLTLSDADINNTLGTQFSAEDIKLILENVEFAVDINGLEATVTVPFWRNDIHIPEDLIEEIGRLSGYDSINLTSPRRDFTAVKPDSFDQLRSLVRKSLVRAGANEVLTYSFIHGDIMKKAGQDPEQAYRLTNSLSPELQYYRQSLAPSLLQHIFPNIKNGYEHFALFELNKFHTKLTGLSEENVPKELDGLAFVIARNKKAKGSAYYEAKQYLDYIAATLGLEFAYEPLEEKSDYPVTQPFEPKRSARIWDAQTRERIGVIGEFKKSVQKGFKLPEYVAGFEIAPRGLLKAVEATETTYRPLSKYPGTERDVCFQVAQDVSYQQIVEIVNGELETNDLITYVEPLDFYQAENSETKNITIRLKLASYDKTLTGEEVSTIMAKVTDKVVTDLNAQII